MSLPRPSPVAHEERRATVSIVVTGSLAFDHIMTFPGYFKEHILPDKVHTINVSFLVDRLQRQRGGTAGNIAYSLALLGVPSYLIASTGSDAGDYLTALSAMGVRTDHVLVANDDFSASAFITTDRADNQITGFYPGAMLRNGSRSLHDADLPGAEWGIVAADDPAAMVQFAREFRELGLPYIFDPGQGIPVLSGADLLDAITGASVLIANDYELALIQEKTRLGRQELRQRVAMVVVTLGEAGSEIDVNEETIPIPAVKPEQVLDPTGAGDAYRAGLLFGLTRGFAVRDVGRLAAVAATYAIEQVGTQAHWYTSAEFARRYRDSFPDSALLDGHPQSVADQVPPSQNRGSVSTRA